MTTPFVGELASWPLDRQTQVQHQEKNGPFKNVQKCFNSSAPYPTSLLNPAGTHHLVPIAFISLSCNSRTPQSLPTPGLASQNAFVFQHKGPSVILLFMEKLGRVYYIVFLPRRSLSFIWHQSQSHDQLIWGLFHPYFLTTRKWGISFIFLNHPTESLPHGFLYKLQDGILLSLPPRCSGR